MRCDSGKIVLPRQHLTLQLPLSASAGSTFVARRAVACLVEGGEPGVEELAGGGVGDEADLVPEAGQANEDGGVNGADVVSLGLS